MRSVANECGSRNSFGYYDARAKEIVLKRPCQRKTDIDEALSWFDYASDLKKVSIGIGAVENFVINNSDNGQYSAARSVIKQNVYPNMPADNGILYIILGKLQNKKELRNISLKCFIFAEDQDLFNELLKTIQAVSGSLVYLDLTGSYFSDEQLVDLAEVIAKSHIAHLIWPEPRMSQLVFDKIFEKFKNNHALVLVRGMPLEMLQLSADNRQWLFDFGRRPSMIGDNEVRIIKEYKDSLRIAIAYEKQLIMDLEKAIEAVLA